MRKEIRYNMCGTICRVAFFNKNEAIHNDNGPASWLWHDNGQKKHEQYLINNLCHNNMGSATKHWKKDGCECYKAYFLNDAPLSKEEWKKEMERE